MLQESLKSFQDLGIQQLSMIGMKIVFSIFDYFMWTMVAYLEENSQLKKEIEVLMEKHFITEEVNFVLSDSAHLLTNLLVQNAR